MCFWISFTCVTESLTAQLVARVKCIAGLLSQAQYFVTSSCHPITNYINQSNAEMAFHCCLKIKCSSPILGGNNFIYLSQTENIKVWQKKKSKKLYLYTSLLFSYLVHSESVQIIINFIIHYAVLLYYVISFQ